MRKCKSEAHHCEASRRVLTPAELSELAEEIAERVAAKLAGRPRYLGRVELAKEFGVTPGTIDRWRGKGMIPEIKMDGGKVLFDPQQVHLALSQRSAQ